MTIMEQLKNPPKRYRPIPFWSWNEKLTPEETKRQIHLMDRAGMGGYFMHARGGLQTEYMGQDWFENIDVGVNEGVKTGMGGWAYDENGWPSGFGNGIVNGLGPEYCQKYLRIEAGEGNTPHTITNIGGYHLYYEINEFYIDNLDKKVVQKFIEVGYKPYCERYKGKMPGIFTDEPQISRSGIPWSLILPEAYEKEYHEDLLAHLSELFYEIGDYKQTRFQFWRLVSRLFTESYVKQIYEYMEGFDMELTGHMVLEETLYSQLVSNGAVMPNYEYFHIPGIDWLTRNQIVPVVPLQVASVAHQLGKKQILTESFALCGHNVSFEELRWLLEGQFVRGVNLLCPHLEGYSLRGIRKRDYPPAMYYQQPWWEEYGIMIEQMTRIGILLTEGKAEFETLLIHPQSTAWILYNDRENAGIDELNAAFAETIHTLERKHIPFHLGDEQIMERHAKVEGAKLIIGMQSYTTVVLPQTEVLFENTRKLLDAFEKNGGKIVSAEALPKNTVCDNDTLTYTKRRLDDFDMHYFVNETTEEQKAQISVGNRILNISSGEFEDFDGEYTFSPMDSLVVIDDRKGRTAPKEQKPKRESLSLDGEWTIEQSSMNALVLDSCDYWFDGELVEKNAYILDVGDRANALERKVDVKLRFSFAVKELPKRIYAVVETPEMFDIEVNGAVLEKKDCGYYLDSAFRMFDIAKLVKKGENEIVMCCSFEQSPEVYQAIRNSRVFESERNKLSYDAEIEGIFIVGDFGVETAGEFEALDKHALRYRGNFEIGKSPAKIKLSNIEQQGFPFFAGELTLSKKIYVEDTAHKLTFDKFGINAIHVKVNGEEAGTLIWNPYELDLSPYLQLGENKLELTLVNNLRNLLGPHHLDEGEIFAVGPSAFYKNDSPFFGNLPWNDDFCFVEFSIQ